MNPDEDLPEEVRDRAYHAQPVWKRIVVIAAGPAVNLVLAFVLLFIFFAADRAPPRVRATSASSRRAIRPRACWSRGTGWSRWTGHRGGAYDLSKRIASHKCPQKPPKKGCKAAEPVESDGQAGRRRCAPTRSLPIYDPAAIANAARLRLRARTRMRSSRLGEAFDLTADRFWFITKSTLELPARLINPEQRKEITGVVGSYETTRQTILNQCRGRDRDPRDHLALTRDREPVPVPAARRRSHLLGDR